MKQYIPSVTEILHDLGYINLSGIPLESLETARQLGTSIHEICKKVARGQRVELVDGSPMKPYVDRFQDWLTLSGAKPIIVEKRLTVRWPLPAYTGKPDLILSLGRDVILADIKKGKPEVWHDLQLEAYRILAKRVLHLDVNRIAVLSLAGRKAMLYFVLETVDTEWQRALLSWHWRYEHGLIKKK